MRAMPVTDTVSVNVGIPTCNLLNVKGLIQAPTSRGSVTGQKVKPILLF